MFKELRAMALSNEDKVACDFYPLPDLAAESHCT